jgi:hypothetical protein
MSLRRRPAARGGSNVTIVRQAALRLTEAAAWPPPEQGGGE